MVDGGLRGRPRGADRGDPPRREGGHARGADRSGPHAAHLASGPEVPADRGVEQARAEARRSRHPRPHGGRRSRDQQLLLPRRRRRRRPDPHRGRPRAGGRHDARRARRQRRDRARARRSPRSPPPFALQGSRQRAHDGARRLPSARCGRRDRHGGPRPRVLREGALRASRRDREAHQDRPGDREQARRDQRSPRRGPALR